MWSKQMLELLLTLYEKHENLYDINHPDYQNRAIRGDSLEQICERLKEMDKEVTIEAIKNKIHGMRSQYWKEVNEIKASKRVGGKPYVPKLWWFSKMAFMRNHINPSRTPTIINRIDRPKHRSYSQLEQKQFAKLEDAKAQILAKAVAKLEKSSSASSDESSALSASWEALYRKLNPRQKIFANRVITEALYQAAFDKLNENSHKLLEAHCNDSAARPSTSRRPEYISKDDDDDDSICSSPPSSPIKITSSPSYKYIDTQEEPLINYGDDSRG